MRQPTTDELKALGAKTLSERQDIRRKLDSDNDFMRTNRGEKLPDNPYAREAARMKENMNRRDPKQVRTYERLVAKAQETEQQLEKETVAAVKRVTLQATQEYKDATAHYAEVMGTTGDPKDVDELAARAQMLKHIDQGEWSNYYQLAGSVINSRLEESRAAREKLAQERAKIEQAYAEAGQQVAREEKVRVTPPHDERYPAE